MRPVLCVDGKRATIFQGQKLVTAKAVQSLQGQATGYTQRGRTGHGSVRESTETTRGRHTAERQTKLKNFPDDIRERAEQIKNERAYEQENEPPDDDGDLLREKENVEANSPFNRRVCT